MTPISYIDIDGFKYYALYQNIIKNKGSRKFDISNPYTNENIELWLKIHNKDLKLISDYKDSKTVLYFQDKYSYKYCSCLHNIILGENPERFSKSNIFTIDNIKLWIKLNNPKYILITQKYVNSSIKMDFKDLEGFKYYISWNKFSQHNFKNIIHKFHISNPYTIENIKLWCKLNNKQFSLISDKYEGNNIKLQWNCLKCNNVFKSIWINILKGSGCPNCSKSKGEKEISYLLKRSNISFISQKSYKNLLGLGYGNLLYDFYLPDYNLLIEYQGIQHENFIEYFHKTFQNFEKQQEHDEIKRKYAKNNNINLLEIWYYDFDKIEEIINKIIN